MSRFSLLLCCIVLVGFSAGIVGDKGGDFLDSKEDQVVELSDEAFNNTIRECELLATCNNPSNCSHSVCEPLLGDLKDLTCTAVVNSTYCPALENGITPCPSMNLDYSRSYVRHVVIVLTDGVFATLGDVTLPSAASLSGVKLFLYKLPWSNDMNVYLTNNTLIQQLCAVGGHFEPLLKNLENPLLAINKYFSYMANLKKIETDGRPQYSPMYQSYERFGGDLITAVTKPTFTLEGDLIGAAGITLNLDLMGNLTNPVKNTLLSRITGYNVPTKPIILTAANCTIVKETIQPCGAGSAYYATNGGLCVKTDLTSTIQNLACCGACTVASGSGKSDSKGLIIGVSVGLLVVLVGFGVGCFLYKRKKERPSGKNVPVYSGQTKTTGLQFDPRQRAQQ